MLLGKFLKNGWYYFILFAFFLVPNYFILSDSSSFDMYQKIDKAEEFFKEVYCELTSKDLFNNKEIFDGGNMNIYKNDLTINISSKEKNISENGEGLLYLIEWLQQYEYFLNVSSQHITEYSTLLKALNKFFCLIFRKILCDIEIDKYEEYKLNPHEHFSQLYDHKICNSLENWYHHPFRTTLSKTLVSILIVNYTKMSYKEKKECLVLCLEKTKKELHSINKQLGNNKLKDKHISDFIIFLEVYFLKDPIIKPRNVKRIITIALFSLAIGIVTWYIFRKGGAEKIQKIKDDIKFWFIEMFDKGSKRVAENFMEVLKKDLDGVKMGYLGKIDLNPTEQTQSWKERLKSLWPF
jgi:hypothetical protein